MSKKTKIFGITGVLILGTLVVGLFLSNRFCGFATEIQAYTEGMDNIYYWGPKYCPGVWAFQGINQQKLEKLGSDVDFSIVAPKENSEIEEAVENKYLGYNKIIAEGGESSFVIYQINCQSCKN